MQGGGGGEMGELMAMLAKLQSQSGAVAVTAEIWGSCAYVRR